MLSGECVTRDGLTYFSVTVAREPSGARVGDITGDVVVNGQVRPAWGLHLIDVNLAMGNLVDIVGEQSKAFLVTASKK
jgi:hypothetical protein